MWHCFSTILFLYSLKYYLIYIYIVYIFSDISNSFHSCTFKLYRRWNCCHTDDISTWFYISFVVHIFQTSKQQYQCNSCHSSSKWQQEIIMCVVCCINTVIPLRCYIVLIYLFHIINWFIKQNIYRFCFYNTIYMRSKMFTYFLQVLAS